MALHVHQNVAIAQLRNRGECLTNIQCLALWISVSQYAHADRDMHASDSISGYLDISPYPIGCRRLHVSLSQLCRFSQWRVCSVHQSLCVQTDPKHLQAHLIDHDTVSACIQWRSLLLPWQPSSIETLRKETHRQTQNPQSPHVKSGMAAHSN